MPKKLSQLTVEEFKSIIRSVVHKELIDYDPDEGLELKEEIIQRLKKSSKENKNGKQKTISFDKVFNKSK